MKAKPKKRSRYSVFTMVLLAVFVVSAVGSAYLTYRYVDGPSLAPIYNGPKYDAGEFTVDLAPDGAMGRRIAKVQIVLQTSGNSVVRALRQRETEVRDGVIKILRNKTPSAVSGQAGMEVLEQDVIEAINEVLGGEGVTRVFFPEFVMQ